VFAPQQQTLRAGDSRQTVQGQKPKVPDEAQAATFQKAARYRLAW